MKVFVINLERSSLRRRSIEKQLIRLSMDYSIVKGIDYKNMLDKDFSESCSARFGAGGNFIKSVFATSLSHLSVCKKIIDLDLPCAFIIEDDVILPDDIIDILAELEGRLSEGSVFLLRYYSHMESPLTLTRQGMLPLKNHGGLFPVVQIRPVASAAAYIITRDVAERMLTKLVPVDHEADNFGLFNSKGIFEKLYCLYPQVIVDAPFTSVIEYPATTSFLARLKARLRSISLINKFVGRIRVKKLTERHKVVFSNEHAFWER